ncbi:MAG: excisionase family DNA-binding protein [Phascolarctobacterium sp.]
MVGDNSIINTDKSAKPRFITVKQLCDYIGNDAIKPYSIYELIKKKEIPAITLGSKILIPTEWVDEYFNTDKLMGKK